MRVGVLAILLFLGFAVSAQDHGEVSDLKLEATPPRATLIAHDTIFSLHKLYWRDKTQEDGGSYTPSHTLIFTKTPIYEDDYFHPSPTVIDAFEGFNASFELIDLDGDGTEELLIFYDRGGYGFTAKIYRIKVYTEYDFVELIPIETHEKIGARQFRLEVIDQGSHREIKTRSMLLSLDGKAWDDFINHYKLEGNEMIQVSSEIIKHLIPSKEEDPED